MLDHSITVNGVDLREQFGILVERVDDVLSPQLRSRKTSIPNRDGAYDFGAKYYDERSLTVYMASTKMVSRADVRELSYILSKKGRIVRWDEPDKYYIGQIYDPTVIEKIAGPAKRFTTTFICEPFAYGEQVTENFSNSAELEYAGTARTPTHITITNPNDYPMTGIVITMQEAVEQ